MKNGLLIIPLLLWAVALAAQHQDITFTAELSKDRMLLNSTVAYNLTLRNAQGEQLTPPDFSDFEVLQGPNRSIGTTILNGVASSQMTFSWMLQPKRTGTLTVGPATVRAAGRTYRANAERVEVLDADAGNPGAAPENFLRAEVSTDRAYVGQQIILNLNLYASVNPISRNMVREPDLDGFFARPRRRFDAAPTNVIENGREYQRRTLASLALFPIKSGTLTIDPYRMVIGAVRTRGNSSFSRRFTEQIPVNSDTVYVEVRELPQPRPADFSGGVGTYQLDVQVDRNQLTTDDALQIVMQVTGQGDVQRIEAPTPVDARDWNIYDPRVTREEFLDGPSGMFGRKTFEYQLVPKRSGTYDVAPSLTYFDTDRGEYVTLTPENFAVTVAGGSGQKSYTIDTAATVVEAPLTLRPAPPLRPGRRFDADPAARPWFWGMMVLPLLIGGGIIGWSRYRAHRDARDPAIVLRERAGRVAAARLREAKVHLDKVEPRPFYDAIEGALLTYLRDRFSLRVADLGRTNIRQILGAAGAEAGLIERYDLLLGRCEMALYAGQDSAADLGDTYATAAELITETERQLK
ncbi:BatD family protein [Lewinella sp. JB7]|uniref:BatD family protein n=1 Tax=Lewinella sp. JB7 TaxID=2962887 RepID=UPI0020CA09C4|nr:BatD family protein [Lewinella sp. JB7]MCP9234367.1 BatD family protein [Lewinella sp. JB7]